jgi:hypothetical protein
VIGDRARRSAAGPLKRNAAVQSLAAACLVLLAFVPLGACGKKGPPLPPLVKLPAAPADFTAERLGADVKVQFTVPPTNTDGSKPANLERVEIYRFTGPEAATDDQLLKLGTRIARMPVKAPRDPDLTTEADEPPEEADVEEEGLDQGAIAQIEDEVGPESAQPVELPDKSKHQPKNLPSSIGPASPLPSTTYVAVGFNKSGRRGPLSRRVVIPLVSPPMAPSQPKIGYDETTIRITWSRSDSIVPVQEAATADLLPSRFIGLTLPEFSYHVYDVSPSADGGVTTAQTSPVAGPHRLTGKPVPEPHYEDTRIAWGATRCYVIRTVETFGTLALESDGSPPECTTLVDTFPPAAPKELKAVATTGAINLIWEPNSEPDVVGYIVLRGIWLGESLARITPAPITETTFSDATAPGTRYVYSIQAVDKAGNVGPMSERADDTVR